MSFSTLAFLFACLVLGACIVVVLAGVILSVIADRQMRKEDRENPGWDTES